MRTRGANIFHHHSIATKLSYNSCYSRQQQVLDRCLKQAPRCFPLVQPKPLLLRLCRAAASSDFMALDLLV
jgi:hypothetical protein